MGGVPQTSKVCSKCKLPKLIDDFPWSNGRRHTQCKPCRRQAKRAWRLVHLNYVAQQKRLWDIANAEHVQQQKKLWDNKNRGHTADYVRQRRANDIQYKIRMTLRNRLRDALNGRRKLGSFVRDLGCTIDEYVVYLGSKFRPGYTWENHGKVWHIDHIIPLSKFDLTDREQFLRACHYTNTQPLSVKENLKKGNKF